MLKKGQVITGVCESYANEGEGVIHYDHNVIFVKGLFISEKADILIQYERAHIYYGVIKKLHNLSNYRIKPRCPVATACGGCCFQALDYKEQLKYKTKKVYEALRYIGKIDKKVNDCIGLENPYNYRNKVQMPVKCINKKIYAGYYHNKSHNLIPIDNCSICDERANKIIQSVINIMASFKIDPYDEDKRSGIIRHLLVRTSFYYSEIMLVLVTNCDSFPSRNNFVKAIVSENKEITTIVQNINKRSTNVILGEKERILFGKGFIVDSLCDIKFRISAHSFFQVNPKQTEFIYKFINQSLSTNKDDILVDAYSGVGTIGMVLANKVKKIISIEIEKSSINDAKRNAKENEIRNIEFINGDASKEIFNINDNVDILVMDPPRQGSSKEFLNAIIRKKIKSIIYVSCNPITLARDLNVLVNNEYEINTIQPFDMFPMTSHVETLVSLVLKVR